MSDGLFDSRTLSTITFENTVIDLGKSRPFDQTSAQILIDNSRVTADTMGHFLSALSGPFVRLYWTQVEALPQGQIVANPNLSKFMCYGSLLDTPNLDPAVFSNLTHFEWDRCPNLSLSAHSFSQPRLTKVRIVNENLSSLPQGIFATARSLKFLDLSRNRFTDFNRSILGNSLDLESLNLSHNDFTVAPLSQIQGFPKLKSVDLSRNHIVSLDTPDLDSSLYPDALTLSIQSNP